MKSTSKMHVLQISDEKEKTCVLVARDARTMSAMATVVPLKRMSLEFLAKRLTTILAQLWMEHCVVVVKTRTRISNQGLGRLKSLGKAKPGRTKSEESAVGSSASDGLAERAVLSVECRIRVFWTALEERDGRIDGSHNALTWLFEFAAVWLNRFDGGSDGKKAFDRLRGNLLRALGHHFHFRNTGAGSMLRELDSV